jgi:hypothetical protein
MGITKQDAPSEIISTRVISRENWEYVKKKEIELMAIEG